MTCIMIWYHGSIWMWCSVSPLVKNCHAILSLTFWEIMLKKKRWMEPIPHSHKLLGGGNKSVFWSDHTVLRARLGLANKKVRVWRSVWDIHLQGYSDKCWKSVVIFKRKDHDWTRDPKKILFGCHLDFISYDSCLFWMWIPTHGQMGCPGGET